MPKHNAEIYRDVLTEFSSASPDLSLIESLLNTENFDINEIQEGLSLLDHAIKSDSSEICKLLIDSGRITQQILNIAIKTAFRSYSPSKGDFKHFYGICEMLLKAGANVTDEVIFERVYPTMSYLPLELGYDLLKLFLDHCDNFNLFEPEHRYDLFTVASRMYVESEAVKIFELLMSYGVNPELSRVSGEETVLMNLVMDSKIELIKILLNYGADITMQNTGGKTAMDYAKFGTKNLETTSLLTEEMNKRYPGISSLSDKESAAAAKTVKPTEIALDVKMKNSLFSAIGYSNSKRVEDLLKSIESVNVRDHNNNTPLHCVSRVNIARALLEKGADINAKNSRGDTPLYRATFVLDNPDTDPLLAEFLLQQGASLLEKNQKGQTVLYKAALWGREDYVKLYLDHGVPVDEPDIYGKTPLMRAVQKERLGVINLLIKAGANPFKRCLLGKAALDHAYGKKVKAILSEAMEIYKKARPELKDEGVGSAVGKKPESSEASGIKSGESAAATVLRNLESTISSSSLGYPQAKRSRTEKDDSDKDSNAGAGEGPT